MAVCAIYFPHEGALRGKWVVVVVNARYDFPSSVSESGAMVRCGRSVGVWTGSGVGVWGRGTVRGSTRVMVEAENSGWVRFSEVVVGTL